MHKIIPIVFLFIFISGCGDIEEDKIDNTPLKVTLILRDRLKAESSTFAQGDTIEFFLTVTNDSTEAKTLDFSTGKQVDFYITLSSDPTVLWRWSDDQAFIQAATTLVVAAQSTITVTGTWDQVLSDETNLSTGTYTAFASLLDQSPTDEFNFSVQ